MTESNKGQFEGLLDKLDHASANTATVSFGEVLEIIGAQGFGPLLAVLAAFLILPSGMIPGMPAVIAVVLAFIAFEIVLGNHRLRLPIWVKARPVPARTVAAFVRGLRPLARRAGRVLRPRLTIFATGRTALLLVAAVLSVTALMLFFLGFLPGMPLLLAIPVLLMGLGLSTRDGAVLLAGLILFLLPAGAIIARLFRLGLALLTNGEAT